MDRKGALLNLRQVLLKRRDNLLKALASDLASLGDANDEISQLAEVESQELERVNNALSLMRQKQYGICQDCGINIPIARLNALPCATRCVKCQRLAEILNVELKIAVEHGGLPDTPDVNNEAEPLFTDIEL